MAPDPLDDFDEYEVTYDGKQRSVYRKGSGPAVVVISEIPGITPQVADFARRVEQIGCTVAMPVLFGDPGREISGFYVMRSLLGACISREFTTWATGRTSPVTVWLRHLARDLHDELGGPGVGAVGMCLTGGFALAMMVDDSVVAPVLSQPSLPFGVTKKQKADVGVSAEDLARVKQRMNEDDVCLLAYRFTSDRAVPEERFATLKRVLGERNFRGVSIPSPDEHFDIAKGAHSVLTEEWRDEPADHPTRQALDEVLGLFRERLLEASSDP